MYFDLHEAYTFLVEALSGDAARLTQAAPSASEGLCLQRTLLNPRCLRRTCRQWTLNLLDDLSDSESVRSAQNLAAHRAEEDLPLREVSRPERSADSRVQSGPVPSTASPTWI